MALHSVGIYKDYDDPVISKLYYEILDRRSKNKPLDQLMKPNWVTMMIVRVESAKIVMESNGELHPKAKQALLSYEVLEVTKPDGGTEKKLYQKSGVLREVVPLLSTFPIVMEAHLMTNHGSEEDMNQWLAKSNFAVSHVCLPAILEVCHECAKKILSVNFQKPRDLDRQVDKGGTFSPATTVEKSRYKSFAQTVSMTSFSESRNFDKLLIYQDLSTGFVQLRPASSSEITDSIFTELTHLFADMSPPKSLLVDMSEEYLFTQVLERLSSIFSDKIKLEIMKVVDPTVALKVKSMIEQWSRQNVHSKWFIGCYVVQWELNNIKDADGISPHERVFDQRINKPVVVKPSVFRNEYIVNTIDNFNINASNDVNDYINEHPVLELPANFE